MENLEKWAQRVALLLGTELYCLARDTAQCLPDIGEDGDGGNPLLSSAPLRESLRSRTEKQAEPLIALDDELVGFLCVAAADAVCCLGPLCLAPLTVLEWRRWYAKYGGAFAPDRRAPRILTLPEVLGAAQMLGMLVSGQDFSTDALLRVNALEERGVPAQEKVRFDLTTAEEELPHHTYQEERRLLTSVREGRVEDALRQTRELDALLGKMSRRERDHWRNAAVASITLCTRAAIEGGVSPAVAYRLSDFYIQKCDACPEVQKMLHSRNEAIRAMTEAVREKQQARSTYYTEQCKNYIRAHYREKILLADLSVQLGLSESYISRLFHEETGDSLQDYLCRWRVERAAELLLYTDKTLAEIAEFVYFPSQSYLGKMFRKYRGVSPHVYRSRNKPPDLR